MRIIKKPHSEKYTLPFVALLTVSGPWTVKLSRSRNPEFSFRQAKPIKFRAIYDAFEVTKEFLDLKSPEDALPFFEKYGPFQFRPNESRLRKAESVRWNLLQNKAQPDFSAALTSDFVSSELYQFVFGQPLRVELKFRAVTSEILKTDPTRIDDAAVADCEDVVTAMRASIFLKRMHGFRWKRCARHGCNELFQIIEASDRKKYCTPECAHLEAVNRYNARNQNKRRKGKMSIHKRGGR
jgi:hypothetical protein